MIDFDAVTIEWIKKEIRQLDPELNESDETFKAAVVLLSSIFLGPNIKRISSFTRYPRSEIGVFSKNLRSSKVWRGPNIYIDWESEESGDIAFWLDVAVALGHLVRA